MRLIPTDPLIIEVSPDEREALEMARGGHSTEAGTPDHQLFKTMAEKGLVKEVMMTAYGIAWRLTRDGLLVIS